MKNILLLFFVCMLTIGWDSNGGWNRGVVSSFAQRALVEKATTSDTITSAESGKIFVIDVTRDSIFTLPPTSPGMIFSFVAADKDTIKVKPYSTSDTIVWSVSSVPLSAGDRLFSTGATGDSVTVISPESGKWAIKDMRGNWTDGN
jgi:hypothetical protein